MGLINKAQNQAHSAVNDTTSTATPGGAITAAKGGNTPPIDPNPKDPWETSTTLPDGSKQTAYTLGGTLTGKSGNTPPIDPNPNNPFDGASTGGDGYYGENDNYDTAPPPATQGNPDGTTVDPIQTQDIPDPQDPVDIGPKYTPGNPKTESQTGTGGVIDTDPAEHYDARTGQSILDESNQGLISMLDGNNPLMELERAKGRRYAESRGMGGSSYAARAAEGAAIEAALPMVMQAMQLGSNEHLQAQALNAQAEIQASNRRMQAKLQEQQIAFQAGDNAKARQLERDIQYEKNLMTARLQEQELTFRAGDNAAGRDLTATIEANRNNLTNLMQARDLAIKTGDAAKARDLELQIQNANFDNQRYLQARDIELQISENDLNRKLQEAMQDTDIDYKKWLEQATYDHQALLQTNENAFHIFSQFNSEAMAVLNNHETTGAQKTAALDAMREGLAATLNMLSGTGNIDLSAYLPVGYNPTTGMGPLRNNPITGGANGSTGGSTGESGTGTETNTGSGANGDVGTGIRGNGTGDNTNVFVSDFGLGTQGALFMEQQGLTAPQEGSYNATHTPPEDGSPPWGDDSKAKSFLYDTLIDNSTGNLLNAGLEAAGLADKDSVYADIAGVLLNFAVPGLALITSLIDWVSGLFTDDTKDTPPTTPTPPVNEGGGREGGSNDRSNGHRGAGGSRTTYSTPRGLGGRTPTVIITPKKED